MELILREDVAGLGIIGDVVKVKPGFARNFLLPRGLAVVADRRNLGQLEHHKRIIAAKKAREHYISVSTGFCISIGLGNCPRTSHNSISRSNRTPGTGRLSG